MTNANPIWKPLLLAAVLAVGALFALPNLFGSDPAVQVSGRDAPASQTSLSVPLGNSAETDCFCTRTSTSSATRSER